VPLVVPAKVRVPDTRALRRERLEGRLVEAFSRRLTLVIAPAGSGKTTLLARFAATCDVPAGWYRAETWDADEAAFVRHLEASLRGVVPGLPGAPGSWATVEDVARSLELRPGTGPVLLVIDDLHALEGTPAEVAFGRFVEYAPPWLAIVVASRVAPGVNLSRLQVAGELLELSADDLRFRAWEVEQLYREVYRDPVPPMILAALARRTEGWAAGLQLFHLASHGKPLEERQRMLAGIGSRSRLVREYLTRNVVAELPPELRDFLRETCVLGRLDVGEVEARRRYARAAELLEGDGALAEALTAWCRAEDWDAVQRLLHRGGERLAAGKTAWLENLPPALVRHDPWLALAAARSARSEGRWATALDWYARAEAGFGATDAALDCRDERGALIAWLEPNAKSPAGWSAILRGGLTREPLVAAREAAGLDAAHGPVVLGLLRLAAGHVREASRTLHAAADGGLLDPAMAAVAALGLAASDLLAGERRALGSFAVAVEAAERAGLPWLAGIGRAVAQQLAGVDPVRDRTTAVDPADVAGNLTDDPWGGALLALVTAWLAGDPRTDVGVDRSDVGLRRSAAAASAAQGFHRLGFGVLESWARSLGALGQAEQGTVGARDAARAAETLARGYGTPGPLLIAYRALTATDPGRASDYTALAENIERDSGLSIPTRDGGIGDQAQGGEATAGPRIPVLEISLFGGFELRVDGLVLDLDVVKPRARALLRLLALHAPAPVHREVLQEALWPDGDAAAGARSLQVCVSALRGLLSPISVHDAGRLVARHGDAYRLAVPADAIDLRRFEHALANGRGARAHGDVASADYRVALDLYRGDLLPEDGPAEWVVGRRAQAPVHAPAAAPPIAEEALAAGNAHEAIRVCRRGLAINRYDDPLWRLLIECRERAGDTGALQRERLEYQAVLAGLDVEGAGVSTHG
jgi:DNA-binding SARP family transcriptional activator